MKTILLLLALLRSSGASIKSIDLSNAMTTTWDRIVANGNPPVDQPKPLHDVLVAESEHSLALLKCSSPLYDYASGCTATTHTHAFDGRQLVSAKTCQLSPPIRDESAWVVPDSVNLLKSDRLLVAWKLEDRVDGWRLKSQLINMDTCRSSDYIAVSSREQLVAPFKRHFDLVFRDERGCSADRPCKISTGYDGRQLHKLPKPIAFPYASPKESYIVNKVHTMISDTEEGMVLSGRKYEAASNSILSDVYSPTFGWRALGGYASLENVYSNSSGYASLCWLTNGREELSCTWLDGTRPSDNLLAMRLGRPLVELPWIHNTPNGYLLMMKEGYEDGAIKLFVDKAHPEGKCGRIMEVEIPGEPERVELTITRANEYCFSFIFADERTRYTGLWKHSFVTKCTDMPLDLVPEDITLGCGANYGP